MQGFERRIFNLYKWEGKGGLDYDSTLGFSQLNGFRCGICHPFKPFDILEERVIDIYELPLMVMDATLFGSLQFSVQSAEKYIRLIIDKVQEYQGRGSTYVVVL